MIRTSVGVPGALTDQLPTHPRTGLQALGVTRRGPIWPVIGGSEPTGEPAPQGEPTGQQDPAPQPTGQAPEDVASLPPWAQKLIADTRTEAAKHRTDKQNAAQQAQAAKAQRDAALKALGIDPDAGTGTGAPKDPNADVAALRKRLDDRDARDAAIAWTGGVELAVKGVTGVDVDKLMDSRAFVDSLDQFTDDDPTDPGVRQRITEHVKAYVEKHTAFKTATTGRAPARSGGDHPGGSGTADPITEADLDRMSAKEIDAALRAGRLKHLL